MSIETASERKRKRVVEYMIGSFKTAREAITFGNTVEQQIEVKSKFRQHIGSPDMDFAITEAWDGPTVLKMIFMEVDHNTATYICERVNQLVNLQNKLRYPVQIVSETVREKPQPQRISFTQQYLKTGS